MYPKFGMKKIYIIEAVLLLLGLVSCQKEVIRPECGAPSEEVRTYRTGSTLDQGETGDTSDETSEGDITDPNSDKDESARRKK